MNAAVWFGAALFFFLGVIPATASTDLKQLLRGNFESYSGIIDHLYWDNFLALQLWCGMIAVAHQFAEWLYLGRRLQRLTTYLVAVLFCMVVIDGLWLQPQLERLHQAKFAYRKTDQGFQPNNSFTQEQRIKATRSLNTWGRVAKITSLGMHSHFSLSNNWFALAGLGILLWRISTPTETLRFVPSNKFRS